MKRLLKLYPARWRQEYGDELAQLLDDLGPLRPARRLTMSLDLVRGAFDAHLMGSPFNTPATGTTIRRAVLVAGIVWSVLSVEIVLSNVVVPSTEDNDGLSVGISYLGIFTALILLGFLAGRRAGDWRVHALAGGIAGALIGVLTIGTYAVVDNAFLSIVSRQQPKLDGLANSGLSSMRTYINLSLLHGGALLSIFLTVTGAFLSVLGGRLRSSIRPGRAVG